MYSSYMPASGGERKYSFRHLRPHYIISIISNKQSHFVETCAWSRKRFSSDCEILNPDTRPEGNGKNLSNFERNITTKC